MVIVKIFGGLGNQMFQYAMGLSMAYKKECELKLDISDFEVNFHHQGFNLDIYNIDLHVADFDEIAKLKNITKNKYLQKINFWNKAHIFEKKYFKYDSKINEINGSIYLDGYWQNEEYFNNISVDLKNAFTLKNKISDNSNNYLNKINTCNSVSIHVRRGDYVSIPNFYKVHGTCNMIYYQNAIKFIYSRIKNPTFFIFSDDIIWAKENFDFLENYHIVDGNHGNYFYEDMILMSKCKANIIANSTFSWWGAWLNNHDNKLVIAPNKWLNSTNIDASEVIPKSWIKIE